jgi:hypothetical protein
MPDCAVVQQKGRTPHKLFKELAWDAEFVPFSFQFPRFFYLFAFSSITLDMALPSSVFLHIFLFTDFFPSS